VALVVVALSLSGCFLDRRGTSSGEDAGPQQFDAGPVAIDAGPEPDDAGPPPFDAGDRDAGEALEPPGPPSTPTFSDIGETTATVRWEAPSTGGPVVTYEVERAPDVGGLPGPFTTLSSGVPASPLVDAGLTVDTTYWYRVRAVNDAGIGAPSEAASVTTVGPLVVTRVQTAEADATEPSATFASAPAEGNLLIAVVFMRLDSSNPDIDGWDELLFTHFKSNNGNRRGLAVFARVAGEDEGAQVELDWEPDRESRLLVLELAPSAPVTWTFEEVVSDDSGGATVDSIGASATVTPADEQLWIAAFGTRDDPGSDVTFDGMGMGLTRRGSRTAAFAFAQASGGATASTTARWSTRRHATIGLVVYSMTRR